MHASVLSTSCAMHIRVRSHIESVHRSICCVVGRHIPAHMSAHVSSCMFAHMSANLPAPLPSHMSAHISTRRPCRDQAAAVAGHESQNGDQVCFVQAIKTFVTGK